MKIKVTKMRLGVSKGARAEKMRINHSDKIAYILEMFTQDTDIPLLCWRNWWCVCDNTPK